MVRKDGGIFIMLEITKDEIPFDYELKDRLEFICKYANREARFFNGYVISIDRTNLHYVEPHKLIIGNHLFLFFNFKKEVYYQNLKNKIDLKDFNNFIIWLIYDSSIFSLSGLITDCIIIISNIYILIFDYKLFSKKKI